MRGVELRALLGDGAGDAVHRAAQAVGDLLETACDLLLVCRELGASRVDLCLRVGHLALGVGALRVQLRPPVGNLGRAGVEFLLILVNLSLAVGELVERVLLGIVDLGVRLGAQALAAGGLALVGYALDP